MPHSGPTDHLIPWLPAAVFLEVKLLERVPHNPPPSSADMVKVWWLTAIPRTPPLTGKEAQQQVCVYASHYIAWQRSCSGEREVNGMNELWVGEDVERGDFMLECFKRCASKMCWRETASWGKSLNGMRSNHEISTKSRKIFNISLSYTPRHQTFPQADANSFVDTYWTQTEPNSVSRIQSYLHYCSIYYLCLPYKITWALGSTLGCLLWGGGEVEMRPMRMADDYTIFICQVFRNSGGLNLREP